jgi:hypothetical protein
MWASSHHSRPATDVSFQKGGGGKVEGPLAPDAPSSSRMRVCDAVRGGAAGEVFPCVSPGSRPRRRGQPGKGVMDAESGGRFIGSGRYYDVVV